MVGLSVKLPASTYGQLQAAASKEHKSINDFLVELLFQRFPSPPSSQSVPVQDEREFSLDYRFVRESHRFVTDWALPDQYPQKCK